MDTCQCPGSVVLLLETKRVGGHEEQYTNVFGMSNEDIEEMPRLVRHFKCQGSIESGNPGCDSNKFTHVQGKCGERKGKTRWHPGS